MTDPDRSIGRVLQALRDTQPTAGLELRILGSLKDRVAQPSPGGWGRLITLLGGLSRGFAITAAVCLCAAILALIHRGKDRPPSGANQSLATASIHALVVPVAKNNPPEAVPFQSGKLIVAWNRTGVKSRASGRVTAPEVDPEAVSIRQRRIDASTYDLLAERETSAPSTPPPPMPLTEQERLLVRLAHKGYSEEATLLNADVQARKDAEGRAEFADFFEHPLTHDNN